MRVLHVITALGLGGAEGMLVKLLRARALADLEQYVVTLLPGGVLAESVRDTGRELCELDLLGPLAFPRGLSRLALRARSFAPDVVQGWMYHGNLGAWVAAAAQPRRVPLVWGVRQSLPTLRGENAFARGAIHLGRWLSRRPDTILFNSEASRRQHVAFGFHAARMRHLANGFDTDRFAPDEAARRRLRSEWQFGTGSVVFGLFARYHPFKNQAGFVAAARNVLQRHPEARFVLAGTGVTAGHEAWAEAALALGDTVRFLGERHDMPALQAAVDVVVSASTGVEGFSNTVGEAMSSGTPCVVTDVGDARQIVGETGIVVPAGDLLALADAMSALVAMGADGRAHLGISARRRVLECFGLESVAAAYSHLWHGLVAHPRA